MPVLDPTPKQWTAIRKLAASSFDPDDYKNRGAGFQAGDKMSCDVCRCRHAPDGVCGYCRALVKRIRAEKPAPVEKEAANVVPDL